MASVYDAWIDKITHLQGDGRVRQVAAIVKRKKPRGQILTELLWIGIGSAVPSILTDKQKTAFFFVIVPEECHKRHSEGRGALRQV
jgi:hypothetical protein